MNPWLRAPALLVALAFLAGCGYTLAGRGSFLPERIKVLGIPPFDSAVARPLVAEKLTAAVTKEFVARGRYRVVATRSGADAVLLGRLSGLITTPIAFDADGRATRSLLSLTAGVQLRDMREDRVLYENPAFQFRTELELGQGPEEFADPESEALDEIARDFARSLVATIIEGF